MDGLLLIILNLRKLMHKALDVFGRGYVYEVLFALFEQISQLSLRFFTRFHLFRKRKIMRSLFLVELDELGVSDFAELVDYVPGFVFLDCEHIKLHSLRSVHSHFCLKRYL